MGVEVPSDESVYETGFAHPDISHDDEFDCVVILFKLHLLYFYIMWTTEFRIKQYRIQQSGNYYNKQMQVEQLTQNGIQRLFKGEPVIVQILRTSQSVIARTGEQIETINASISDGFAYFESICLFLDSFPDDNVTYTVVRLKLAQAAVRKTLKGKLNGPLFVDTSDFAVVNDTLDRVIGNPIKYDQWIKNGKKNPKGDRKIFQQNKKDNQRKHRNQDNQDDDSSVTNDLFKQAQKLKKMKKQKQLKIEQQIKIEESREISKPKKQAENRGGQNQVSNRGQSNKSRNSNNQSNNISSSIAVAQKSKPALPSKPIVKIQKPQQIQQGQRRNSIKPEVKHHGQPHEKIKQLFLGLENFRLMVRLLFVWPVKQITNKKGNNSELLNLEFGDETGTIMCTVFGDNASKFAGLEMDRVFLISGANITQSKYRGVAEIKLNFNDGTKVEEVKEKQCRIPTIDKFCLSVKQLEGIEKGQVVNVMCLVKSEQKVGFVSKNGNNVVKKLLKLYDLDNQVQCDLTLFNEKAQIQYEQGMYALKGVQVDEFQGNKQFKSSLIFLARHLKNHPLNKRFKDIEQIAFEQINGNSNTKNANKDVVTSFHVVNQKAEELKVGASLWSEVICYLKSIRLGGSSKNVYLGCPLCRKKILNQNAEYCESCNKSIDRPIYRYILSVNLIDDHDNLWLNAYDEVGQALLTKPGENPFTADKFAEMTEQQLRQRVQEIRYRQVKAKIVTSKQVYNNEEKLRHKVIKLLPVNYAEETKKLLEKILETQIN